MSMRLTTVATIDNSKTKQKEETVVLFMTILYETVVIIITIFISTNPIWHLF